MGSSDLLDLPTETLARQLERREISAAAVVEVCLARIAERDPEIHAWTALDAAAARHEARALDAGPIRGSLHGLPIGVKDIIDTAGLPTEYGSSIHAGHRPAADAQCVSAARAAGAIVLGKTASTEFATFRPTATVNPRDLSRTPGGSSSGSAAAVADRMVPLALGTQTLGSVIRPASYCGIVGYKPSFGTIPVGGVRLIAPSLDTVGVFADSVDAAARFVGAVAGCDELHNLPEREAPVRIGICRTHEWPAVGQAAADGLSLAAASLAAAGAEIVDCELPPEFPALRGANEVIYGFELARSLAVEFDRHREALSAELIAAIESGRRVRATAYAQALTLVASCRAQFAAAIGSSDVLLSVSATGEAPAGLTSTGSPVMNRLWTLLGVPAVSVPAARSAGGLPIGLQIVGPRGKDALTLAAAKWIFATAAAPVHDKKSAGTSLT